MRVVTEQEFNDMLDEAQAAFFAVMQKHFPECNQAPESDDHFESATESLFVDWVDSNSDTKIKVFMENDV